MQTYFPNSYAVLLIIKRLLNIDGFAWFPSYFNWSEYYEEPNDTPDSCLYMCVENYFGISGEWGDKSCSVSGTTKYLCEKS